MTCPSRPAPLTCAKALCLILVLLVCQAPNLFAQTPNGVVVAGGNGRGSALNQFDNPEDIFVDKAGNIYIADTYNNRIQKWIPGATQGVTVAGGNGQGSAANQLFWPGGVHVDDSGNIYVLTVGRITKWPPGATQGIRITGDYGYRGNSVQASGYDADDKLYLDGGGNIYVLDQSLNAVWRLTFGATQGVIVVDNRIASSTSKVEGFCVDLEGNIFIADDYSDRIQKWIPGAIQGMTVAGGNGLGSGDNQLSYPQDVYVDVNKNTYVADLGNTRIQKWAPSSSKGITVAGGNGQGSNLRPCNIHISEDGTLYVLDQNNLRVLKFPPYNPSQLPPKLTTFPSAPKLNVPMTVSGTGFNPSTTVTIKLTKTPQFTLPPTDRTVQTDAQGKFTGFAYTPTELGTYQIKATDAYGKTATLLFDPLDTDNPISIIKPFNGDRIPQTAAAGPYPVQLTWNDQVRPTNSVAAGSARSVAYVINYKLSTATNWSADVVVTKTLNYGNQKDINTTLQLPSLGTYSIRIKHQLTAESFKQVDNVNVERLVGVNYKVTLQNPRFTAANPVKGLVTDGVSRAKMVYEIEPSSYPIKRINVSLSDPIANKTTKELLGTLVDARGIADNVADSPAFNPTFARTFTMQNANNAYTFNFWYVAPTDFSDGTAYLTDATRKVKVTFVVVYDQNGTEVTQTNTYDILLARPPLMLVHGIALTKDETWSTFLQNMQDAKLYLYDLNRSNVSINPGGDGGGGLSGFTNNAKNLLFGNASYGQTSFKSLVNIMTDLGFVCHRVDFLGHGMAANVAHAAVIDNGGRPYFEQSDTYRAGYVNKFINLNAQKNGSPLMDLIEFLLSEINKDLVTAEDITAATSFIKDYTAATPVAKKRLREGIISGAVWQGKLLSRLATRYLAYYILADWNVPYAKHFIQRVPRTHLPDATRNEFCDALGADPELNSWFGNLPETFNARTAKAVEKGFSYFNSFIDRDMLVLSAAANELRNNETNFYSTNSAFSRTILTPISLPKSGVHYLVGDLVGGNQIDLMNGTDWFVTNNQLFAEYDRILTILSTVVENIDELSDYSYIGSKKNYQYTRDELKSRGGDTKDRQRLYNKWYRANRVPYLQDQKAIESITKVLETLEKVSELFKLVGQATQVTNFVFNSDGFAATGSQAANSSADLTAPHVTRFPSSFTPEKPFEGLVNYNYFAFPKQYEVRTRIVQLLNGSIGSTLFAKNLPQPNFTPSGINPLAADKSLATEKVNLPSTYVKTLVDTTLVKIRNPLVNSIHSVNSTVNVKVNVKDTVRFARLEVVFQGQSYFQSEQAFNYEFTLPVSPSESSEPILAKVFYNYGLDSSIVIMDRVRVNINTTETLQSITPAQEVITVQRGDLFDQQALLTYTSYDLTLPVDNRFRITIADTNVVQFDTLQLVFKAKIVGTTKVTLTYKGKQAEFIIVAEDVPLNIVAYPRTSGACAGGELRVDLAKEGYFDPATVFYVELSNAQGQFTAPTLLGSGTALNSISTTLSAGLPPGDGYMIRVRTNLQSYTSTNNQSLTIYDSGTATLSGSQTIGTGQAATLTATLTGAAPWSLTLSNGQSFSGITASVFTFTVAPSITTTYTLTRVADNCRLGIVSGTAIVTLACLDPYEPNNTAATATTLTGTSLTTPALCLSPVGDRDWFRWAYNGKTYYIQVRHYSTTGSGPYRLALAAQGTSVTMTTQSVNGVNNDTYLTLFDSDGIAILATNDDFGGSAFSQIIYDLSLTATCSTATNLREALITPTALWLRWTSGNGVQFSTLQIRQPSSTTWTSYTTNGGWDLNSMSPGTYEWRVVSTCPNGTTSTTTSRTVVVQCSPPVDRYLLGTPTSSGALVGWVGNRDWDLTISYGVRYRAVGSNTWIESNDFAVATFGSSSIRSSITGLTSNTAYEWQVKSICSGSSSSYSPSLTFTTGSNCDAPTSIGVSYITDRSAIMSVLNFTPGDTRVEVQYRLQGSTTPVSVTFISGTPTSLIPLNSGVSVTGLTPATAYEFRMRVLCNGGVSSAFTNYSSFTTSSCLTPTNLSETNLTGTSVRLNWSGPANSTQSLLWRAVGNNGWRFVPGLTSPYNLTGLTPNTAYEWAIYSSCGAGNSSDYTTVRTFTTVCALATATLSGSQTISLGQTAIFSVQLTGVGPWSLTLSNGQSASGIATSPFTVTVAPTSTTTYSLIRVSNDCGFGTVSGSAVVTVTTVQCSPPNADYFGRTATDTRALVTWPAQDGYAYVVRWRAVGSPAWTESPLIPTGSLYSSSFDYTITGLTPGVTYEWQVKTVCSGNSTPYSASATFTTGCLLQPWNIPAWDQNSTTDQTAWLYWSPFPSGTNLAIEYRPQGSTATPQSVTVAGLGLTLMGLLPTTTYEGRLRMVCSSGQIVYSSWITFTTKNGTGCTAMYTVQNGFWDVSSTWSCNRLPTVTDAVEIRHSILIPDNTTGNARQVRYTTGGTLRYGIGAKLRLGN